MTCQQCIFVQLSKRKREREREYKLELVFISHLQMAELLQEQN